MADGRDIAQNFFDSLPDENPEDQIDIQRDILGKQEPAPVEKPAAEVHEDPEGEPEKASRKERRSAQMRYYEEQLERERQERIKEREQLLAELRGTRSGETKQEVVSRVERMRKLLAGDDESRIGLADEFISLLMEEMADTRSLTLQELKLQEEAQAEALNAKAEAIRRDMERIEDKFGVDFSTEEGKKVHNDFLDWADSLSPADSDELINLEAAWPLYQQTRKATPSPQSMERRRDIASRGMVRSSTTARPDAKDLSPLGFDQLDRGNFFSNFIKKL